MKLDSEKEEDNTNHLSDEEVHRWAMIHAFQSRIPWIVVGVVLFAFVLIMIQAYFKYG